MTHNATKPTTCKRRWNTHPPANHTQSVTQTQWSASHKQITGRHRPSGARDTQPAFQAPSRPTSTGLRHPAQPPRVPATRCPCQTKTNPGPRTAHAKASCRRRRASIQRCIRLCFGPASFVHVPRTGAKNSCAGFCTGASVLYAMSNASHALRHMTKTGTAVPTAIPSTSPLVNQAALFCFTNSTYSMCDGL